MSFLQERVVPRLHGSFCSAPDAAESEPAESVATLSPQGEAVSPMPSDEQSSAVGAEGEGAPAAYGESAEGEGDDDSSPSNLLFEGPDVRPFGDQLYWRRHDESVDTTANALRSALHRNE